MGPLFITVINLYIKQVSMLSFQQIINRIRLSHNNNDEEIKYVHQVWSLSLPQRLLPIQHKKTLSPAHKIPY
ncbi:hypothetical protein GCM10027566_02480 [Arachidicoccus ginsenosidivorans]